MEGDRPKDPRTSQSAARVRSEDTDVGRHEPRGTVVDRERQRGKYGGFNFGAAFFGWLVAIGIAALLTALLSAAGAAIGLTEVSETDTEVSSEALSLVGAVLVLAVLAIAYFAGGYVAGRMSRFDGGRQGFGVWALALAVTVLLAIAGAIFGSEYNLFGELDLPRIPIDEGTLATGAVITLVLVLALTAVAAILGGKAGERYHRRVDRVGIVRDTTARS
jgi:hypothetical protein